MGRNNTKSENFEELRVKAEGRIGKQIVRLLEYPDSNTERLIHELQVHQIELEMQNEQLRCAQEELERSRAKYSDLYDFAPVGYFVIDKKGIVVEANLTATSMTGIERKFLIKKPFVQRVSKAERDTFYLNRREVFETGIGRRCELKMLCKDDEFFAELFLAPVKDSDSNTVNCRIAVVDITERKNSERKLAENRERLQLVIESSSTGTWDWDIRTKSVVWNNHLYEMLGLPTDVKDITVETFFHHIHPQDLPHVHEKIACVIKSGSDYEDTFRIVREDGEIRWLSSRGRLFRDEQGKPIRMIGVNYDITKDKQAEEALRESEEKFHGLFNTMGEAFVLLELIRNDAGKTINCRILEANPVIEKMTGIRPAEAVGRTMLDVFPNTDQSWFDSYGEVETTGKPISIERYFEPLGRVYQTCVYRPSPGRVAIVSTDITERKEIEDNLLKAKEESERNEAQLRATLDNLTEGLVIADLDGNLFHWNAAAVVMHGFSSMKECIRKLPEFAHLFELSTEEDGVLPVERWPLARILQGETLRNWEVHIRRYGSNWHRIFNYGGTLARNKEGEALLAVVSVTDVTERRQAAEQVEKLARFPSENPFPVLRITSDGMVLYSNNPGISILEQWNCKVGSEAPPIWRKYVASALDLGHNIIKEIRCDRQIFSIVIAPVIEGGYANLYGRDITRERETRQALRKAHAELEKKVDQRTAELAETVEILRKEVEHRIRAEQFVRERSRVLDAFFSHSIMPLAILDKDFNFVRVNKAYADACERDASQFPGHNHFEFFPHEENQRIFEEVVKTKTPYEAVAKPFSFPDHPEWGITYWDWTLVPVLDEAGEIELLVFSLEDVTLSRQAELAMEESEARYRALVELSPDPVVVVAEEKFAFVNAAGVELVGLSSADEIVGRQIWDFIHPESRRAASTRLRAVLKGKKKIALTELKALRSDGRTVEVEVSVAFIRYKGERAVQVVVRDITKRKQAEERDNLTKILLELFVQKTSMKEYLDSVVNVIQTWSGCRCVGIRLINANNQIPYESYVGFNEEFLLAENKLSLSKDDCVCIRVATHKCDSQEIHLTTERGSFRCNNTSKFIESLTEAEQDRYRGKCEEHGFKSVAVIPFRYREKILGAVHLADERENMVPLENVQFLEDMAALIGEAVHRFSIERALRLSESRLVEAQRIGHIGNWDWDIQKNTLWWSDEVYRIFGLKPEQFKATNEAFLACVHPNEREQVKTAVDEAINGDKTYSMDHRIIRPDGTQRTVHELAEVIYDDQKNAIRMIGTVQDITEFKQAEEKILADQVALRSLTSELQLTEERERRRIANDLHDSIGQILAMSKRELIHLQKSPPADVAISLKEVVKQLDQAVRETRTLSFELSPSVLYDLGLEVALEDLVERFSNNSKINCRFQNSHELGPLPEAIGVLLYRSIRELLINAIKHSNAAEIIVSLNKTEDKLLIVVEDDGSGFDVSILDGSPRRAKGFGVLSIKERLKHIGGFCEIQSSHGKGTKVTLVVPLDNKEITEWS